ncbi:MAG: hypothetical protein H6824_17440 [Planctomycetaceae bacterium]|nr:hypothetical protein [Planctomycetaceae bacterium]
MQLPPQVQSLVDAVSALPGVAACFCSPKPLENLDPHHLSFPGDFGSYPQAIILRTNGGREKEVMIQTEVIFDRSPDAWLSLEFLAWWVRDWGRSGHEIQMRPMALPPQAYEIQLGRTLKFFIEYFVIEEGDSYDKTLAIAGEMGESIAENFATYRECFENPAEFLGDVESI